MCGEKRISRHPAHVESTCPQCGLFLERQVGSYIGGVGLNTIVSFALIIAAILVGLLVTWGERGVLPMLIPALAIAVLFPALFYARSRLLWIALELVFWPLKPDEITDWTNGERNADL